VRARTRSWLERAVIGLRLCPFAQAAYVQNRVWMAVSAASTPDELLSDLARELEDLHAADPATRETTLLIHPGVLTDFLDYNDFLELADATLEALELTGIIQIASFHPHYQFAGTAPEDIENYSNRSPYPLLHLLREDSVAAAVQSAPDVDAIPDRNIATLRALGKEGWARLWEDPPPRH
jgi:uncharacterized protein